jgi:hypothetical protein
MDHRAFASPKGFGPAGGHGAEPVIGRAMRGPVGAGPAMAPGVLMQCLESIELFAAFPNKRTA